MKSAHVVIAPSVSSALAMGCWIYTLFRALTLSITHDEALTYLIFAHRPFPELLRPEVIGMSANNHLLNTLLSHISVSRLGATEIAMRIPALCGAACYFSACVLIAHTLFRGFAAVCACVLLLANPYVLDFMPLARGYSLALGLAMPGVWLLLLRVKRISSPGLALNFGSALFLGLAPFANLAYLNLFLAGCCCLFCIEWAHVIMNPQLQGDLGPEAPGKRKTVLRHLLRTTALFLIPASALLLVFWQPVALLRKNNQFFFGGENGFVRDTMNSLLHNWLYTPAFDAKNLVPVAWVLFAALLLAGPASLLPAWRRDRIRDYFKTFFPWCWLLFAVPVLESLTQHLLLGTRLLLDRTALFFIPLMLLLLLSGLHAFIGTEPSSVTFRKRAGNALLAGCAALFLCHTLLVSTPGATREWRYSACVEQLMARAAVLAHEAVSRGMLKPPVVVGTNYLFEPSVIFFINKHGLTWMRWFTESTPQGAYPFYLEFIKDARPFLKAGYAEHFPCEASGSALYLRIKPQQP